MLVAKSPHAFLQATGLCQKCWDRMLSDFVNLKQRHSKSAIRNTDLNFENPCLLFENSRNPRSSHHLGGDGGWWAGMVLGGHGIGRAWYWAGNCGRQIVKGGFLKKVVVPTTLKRRSCYSFGTTLTHFHEYNNRSLGVPGLLATWSILVLLTLK